MDGEFEAVVGEFGLAKLMDYKDTHVTTSIHGTIGHIAPEYLSSGKSLEKERGQIRKENSNKRGASYTKAGVSLCAEAGRGLIMEEMARIWERLKLSEEENTPVGVQCISMEKARDKEERSVVGKICSERKIGREVVRSTMEKISRVERHMEFQEIGNNSFIITFASKKDKVKVMGGCPWLFDNYLFVLKDYDGDTQPHLISFDKVSFWIHMLNLPLSCMTIEMGKQIGDSVGLVREIDVQEDGVAWGRVLRGGCGEEQKGRQGSKGGDLQYGVWMRAIPGNRRWMDGKRKSMSTESGSDDTHGSFTGSKDVGVSMDGQEREKEDEGSNVEGKGVEGSVGGSGENNIIIHEVVKEVERVVGKSSQNEEQDSQLILVNLAVQGEDEAIREEMVVETVQGSQENMHEGKKASWKRRARGRPPSGKVGGGGCSSIMKIISWNCRGIGNPRTVQDLCLLTRENKANMVFLIETMSKASKLERLKRRLGMEGCFVVESVGKKGGLALYWRNSEEVEIKSYSTWHINAEVNEEGQGIKWLFTGFYCHPETGKRMFSWDLLRRLKPREQEPWCVVGDFNEILIQTEKVGGRQRAELQMNQFRGALEDTMLYDLGCRNGFYTWSNRHNDHSFTKERLDRCVANNKWRDMFRSASVQGLSARSSDHLPLLVLTRGNEVRQRRGQFPFRFEASWVKEEDCEEKIKQEWVRGQQSTDFVKKVQTRLKFCSGMLVRSFKRKDKERTSEIDQITSKIKEVQEDLGHYNIEELKSLQKQVGGLLEQEDIKWR
ncbi:uncharacterized protein LOC122274609 [Carya illinoinensis]|uniref:uncharacterized protein LOC122274609 n=1 Tax=Carya illinoinensis TaxID=32201 RepID=UPI001C71B278|nr:uncharacterized protein LOC122274609 [Carya illinoinensis]